MKQNVFQAQVFNPQNRFALKMVEKLKMMEGNRVDLKAKVDTKQIMKSAKINPQMMIVDVEEKSQISE